jgi:hypothetical protein
MDLGTVIAVVAVGVSVGWFVWQGSRASYEEQLSQFSGGRYGADVSITEEQRRTPALSREAAAKRVLDRLRRDSS